MASFEIKYVRDNFPGNTDEEIAKSFAQQGNYLAIVRYKNNENESQFTNFASCNSASDIQKYLNSPYCYSAEIIYDSRKIQESNNDSFSRTNIDELDKQIKSQEQNDKGVNYFQEGKINEAVEAFVTSIELNPKHEMPYCNLAYLLIQVGQPNDAIGMLNRVLAINPNREEALRYMEQASKVL